MGRLTAYGLSVVFGLLLIGNAASQPAPSRQALRTCIDRWNQANMVGWGPDLVDIAVRQLVPAEVHNVGSYGRIPRCVASIASKLNEFTFICVVNYPHVDGYIHPWTTRGKLRRGLSFYRDRGARFRGHCFKGTEYTRDSAALRCVSDVQFDPCYAPTADWNRLGAVVACASAGRTHFSRFVIIRRS
jgi:hypothetical protein